MGDRYSDGDIPQVFDFDPLSRDELISEAESWPSDPEGPFDWLEEDLEWWENPLTEADLARLEVAYYGPVEPGDTAPAA